MIEIEALLYLRLKFNLTDSKEEIVETYRILITKESPDEKVILRDIHRTFPAHEFFKEAGGVGQESLYRISKAYSVYDSEIGYCQVRENSKKAIWRFLDQTVPELVDILDLSLVSIEAC